MAIHPGILGNQFRPSRNLQWKQTETPQGIIPQLVDAGPRPLMPGAKLLQDRQSMMVDGRYRPTQIGETPSGIDYRRRYRQPIQNESSDGWDDGTSPSGAEYASRQEAKDWLKAGIDAGYYGSIDDAIDAVNTNPNDTKARAALTSFYNNAKGQPYTMQMPGLLGKLTNALGISSQDPMNIQNVGVTLDQSFTQPGSFDYIDTVTPSDAALETLNTYTPDSLSDSDISSGYDPTGGVGTSLDASYSDFGGGYTPSTPSYSDNNNDSDGGWGGVDASPTDYGSIDDFGGYGDDVSSDSGGDSGGGGTYCCTASVKQKVMTNKELYALHKWHHSQSKWWINGYDKWGKFIAKNLVSKYKYFAHLTKAFGEWKVKGKFSFKALQAAMIIYPGVIIAGGLDAVQVGKTEKVSVCK